MPIRLIYNFARRLTRNNIRILFYHRINVSKDFFIIDPVIFEKQIQYLSRNYTVVGLSDYLDLIENNKYIKNGLLLTFDDGYKDNYTYAYPILRKYSLSAAFFLTTDFIDGKKWIWFDMIRYILDKIPQKNISIVMDGKEILLNLENYSKKSVTRLNIFLYLNSFGYRERMDKIMSIAEQINVKIPALPTEEYAPLSWDEIREMSEHQIEFGSHTCSHEFLSKLTHAETFAELSHSKNRIETELQLPVSTIAYPNGQLMDYTEETKLIARQCGYQYGFTTQPEMIRNFKRLDRLAIGRLFPGTGFDDFFFSNVSGLNSIKKKYKDRILSIILSK